MIKGRDIKDISLSLNLSIDCVRKLANKLSSGLPENNIIKKKGRKPKENSELKTLINCLVEEDNALTQLGMQKTLEFSGIFRSQSFLSKTLKKIDITRKRLSLVPIERNSDRVLDLRRVYAVEMQNTPIENMVFLDETGFNLHTAQHYGYSTKGTKAVTFVKANKSINQTLMCCIDLNGVIGYKINQGAYNGDLFKSFIENHLAEYFRRNKNAILIMDNCRFHHRSDVLRLLNEMRIPFKFIPPYSPQLNPIEEFFSSLKARYNSVRPRPQTLLEIKNNIQGVMSNLNISFNGWFQHMQRHLNLAILRQQFL